VTGQGQIVNSAEKSAAAAEPSAGPITCIKIDNAIRSLKTALILLGRGEFAEVARRLRRMLGQQTPSPPWARLRNPGQPTDSRPKRRASGEKFRIVTVAPHLNRDGAPLSQFELACAWKRAGNEVTCLAFSGGTLSAAYEESGIDVKSVPFAFPPLLSPVDVDRIVIRLSDVIRDLEADAVHVNTYDGFPAVEAAALANVGCVWNIRESHPRHLDHLSYSVQERAFQALDLAHRVVFVADATRRAWADLGGGANFECIENGFDRNGWHLPDRNKARAELAIDENAVAILCVGTLCPRKAQLDLLRAFASATAMAAREAILLFVGGGDPIYRHTLERERNALPEIIRKRIRFDGPMADVQNHYAASDLLVLPSLAESRPRVLIEALASGLPIIATPVSGVPELVSDEESALFFDAGDIKALSNILLRVLSDPAILETLRNGGKEAFGRIHDVDDVAKRYLTLFENAHPIPFDGQSRS
jgi:glycosyltransferase involved in cell wall biosynthesis